MFADNEETTSPAGATGTPSQAASDGKTATPSNVDVKELASALRPLIDDLIARREQAGKDRRIGKLEKKVGDFETQLARFNELKAELGNEKLAHLYMKMEDQGLKPGDEVEEVSASPSTAAGSQPKATSNQTQQALTVALGLDPADAEVTEVLRKNEFSEQVALLVALADKRKKAKEAPVSPAAQMPVGGGGAIPTEDKERIAAELIQLSLEPRKNYQKILELNAKLKTMP